MRWFENMEEEESDKVGLAWVELLSNTKFYHDRFVLYKQSNKSDCKKVGQGTADATACLKRLSYISIFTSGYKILELGGGGVLNESENSWKCLLLSVLSVSCVWCPCKAINHQLDWFLSLMWRKSHCWPFLAKLPPERTLITPW